MDPKKNSHRGPASDQGGSDKVSPFLKPYTGKSRGYGPRPALDLHTQSPVFDVWRQAIAPLFEKGKVCFLLFRSFESDL